MKHRVLGLSTSLACLGLMACQATQSSANTVPFEFRSNQIIIETNIAEQGPHYFILDCGVDPSLLDLATAALVNAPIDETIQGEATGEGDGDGLEIIGATIPNLSIGGIAYGDVEALAADFSGFSKALDKKMAGILGYSLLKDKVLRIDYPAREVTLAAKFEDLPPSATATTQRHEETLIINGEDITIPSFSAEIYGQTISMALDSGSSSGIDLPPATVRKLGIEDIAANGDVRRKLGARGERSVTTSTVDVVKLGNIIISDVPVQFSNNELSDDEFESNVGNAFLSNFVITIDYVDERLIFKR